MNDEHTMRADGQDETPATDAPVTPAPAADGDNAGDATPAPAAGGDTTETPAAEETTPAA